MEASQLTCQTNYFAGFLIMGILAGNGLNSTQLALWRETRNLNEIWQSTTQLKHTSQKLFLWQLSQICKKAI